LFRGGVVRGAGRFEGFDTGAAALAEVANFYAGRGFVGEEDVTGFDVAMNDLMAMEVCDGVSDFGEEAIGFATVDFATELVEGAGGPTVGSMLAGVEAHGVVGGVGGEIEIMKGDDSGVFGDGGEFLEFSGDGGEVDAIGFKDFDGAIADSSVSGAEDHAVGALADGRLVNLIIFELGTLHEVRRKRGPVRRRRLARNGWAVREEMPGFGRDGNAARLGASLVID
jgi:hypothetical protein